MPPTPKRGTVLLTRGAENDLEALHRYLAEFDSPASADRLLDQLMTVVRSPLSPEPNTYRYSARWRFMPSVKDMPNVATVVTGVVPSCRPPTLNSPAGVAA